MPTLRHMESMAEKDLFAALAPVIQDPIQDGVKTLKALEITCERVFANVVARSRTMSRQLPPSFLT